MWGRRLRAKSRWWGRGESRGGAIHRLQLIAPPLALVRSCFGTTSAVNACIDGAKPLTALVAGKGRYCFFLRVEKEEQAQKTTYKGKVNNHNGSSPASMIVQVRSAPLRLGELFLESIRILERRVFPCVAARSRGFTPVPHQGLTPPLDPRKGLHPLTLFPAPLRVDFIPQI